MDFTWIVIDIVFFLLDKGHEAENLQRVFCLYYHFPIEDSNESFKFSIIGKYMYLVQTLT